SRGQVPLGTSVPGDCGCTRRSGPCTGLRYLLEIFCATDLCLCRLGRPKVSCVGLGDPDFGFLLCSFKYFASILRIWNSCVVFEGNASVCDTPRSLSDMFGPEILAR